MRTTARARFGLVLLLPLVLALAACVNITATVDVAADNQITGAMNIALSKELAAAAGITTAEQLKDELTKNGDIPDSMTVTTSADDKNLIVTLSGDLGQTQGIFSATSDGDIQTFKVAVNQEDSGDTTPTSQYQMSVTANFAGTVTAVSEEHATIVDVNTVKFEGPVMSKWSATATVDLAKPVAQSDAPATDATPGAGSQSESTGGLGNVLAILAGLAALVVLGGLAALYLVLRRQKGTPQVPQAPTEDSPTDESAGPTTP